MDEIARRAGARTFPRLLATGALTLGLLAGCSDGEPSRQAAAPIEVGVVKVATEPVTLERELPGRTAAHRVAQVRARVDGIVLERLFEEGAEVKKGQPLFRIDPAPYRAALQSAQANLARAEANVRSRELLAERYGGLLEEKAVSQQEHDDAVASWKAAEAEVAAARAAVTTARLNLGYTTVESPIDGRIGKAEVTEGAFVRQAEATRMAVVQQLDPIYVDLTQSTTEVRNLRRQLESGQLQASGDGAKVNIVLEDGTVYSQPGTLQFSDVTVNPSTGSITLRAIVPNQDGELLPGMFVRAQLEEGVRPEAILVPQVAVRRDAQGAASVLVVGAEGKVEQRAVQAPRAIGGKWLVTDGLGAGDEVIVEGLQKVRVGSPVNAIPAGGAASGGGQATAANR